jgi:TonB family protein
MTAGALTVGAWPTRSSDRRRMSWSMTLSLVIHALLLVLLVTAPAPSHLPEFTEIMMIEPGDLAAPAASAPAASAASPTPGQVHASDKEERFTRSLNRAAIEPHPQSRTAIEDRIATRLASLQRIEPLVVAGTSATGAPSAAWGPATAVSGTGTGGNSKAINLNRGGSGGTGPALSLTRGGSTSLGPAMATTGLPSEGAAAPTPAKGGETTARRNLAGATLMGPIADRAVISYATPTYPDWAKRDGVEGSVTLYFVVRPDGSVKENVLVQKTAGFEDFDENARSALKVWKFQPLTGGRTGEQWGTITFRFRIREAG